MLPDETSESLSEAAGLFLEIGVDESLNEFPFELMHDGETHCCLKHNVGRYVVAHRTRPLKPPPDQSANRRVLLISAPNPKIPGMKF